MTEQPRLPAFRYGMPEATLKILDRLALGNFRPLRSASEILGHPRPAPMPAWDRPWWIDRE